MENAEKNAFRLLPCPSSDCLYITAAKELPETIPCNACLAVNMTDRDDEAFLLALEAFLGNRLLVPEIWMNTMQRAGILISSSLSGGTLDDRLKEASQAAPGRCWLLLEPLRMRLPLPCPSGTGIPLPKDMLETLIENRPSFYSPEFCCRYCYDLPDGIFLYDTEDTRHKKLRLAENHSFNGAILLPWTENETNNEQSFL